MVVSLTQDQADAKIKAIEDARGDAVRKLGEIEREQEDMLRSTWRGDSAQTYANTSAQQHEEFQSLIQTLDFVVEKGSEHIRSIANADH
jgi:uncharacterized protein YukE